MNWLEVQERALEETLDGEEKSSSPVPRLIVVDHFDFSMIEMNLRGARLFVRPISRLDAVDLVRANRDSVVVLALNERGQGLLERELALPTVRPKMGYATRMIVVHPVKWNEIHWYLVEYECDGDGCVP